VTHSQVNATSTAASAHMQAPSARLSVGGSRHSASFKQRATVSRNGSQASRASSSASQAGGIVGRAGSHTRAHSNPQPPQGTASASGAQRAETAAAELKLAQLQSGRTTPPAAGGATPPAGSPKAAAGAAASPARPKLQLGRPPSVGDEAFANFTFMAENLDGEGGAGEGPHGDHYGAAEFAAGAVPCIDSEDRRDMLEGKRQRGDITPHEYEVLKRREEEARVMQREMLQREMLGQGEGAQAEVSGTLLSELHQLSRNTDVQVYGHR
jgi:hypothetical protein